MVDSRGAPPIVDFSAFYAKDPARKQRLVNEIRDCCLYNGFFQITGHNVPLHLQEEAFRCSESFFKLPVEEKMKISKDRNNYNRGYELVGTQILEAGTNPELKEGIYLGEDLPEDHPYFVQKKVNSGPNFWPTGMSDLEHFKKTSMDYYHAVLGLAADVLKVLALTLDLPEDYFDPFVEGAVATMRMLHYPTQPPSADEKLTRGIGAHTDFGAITLLMQGDVDGLQVYDNPTNTWLDVKPTPNAFVVNLGNLFQRWTNDRYVSNLHRVINRSGKERYSIPVFFSGNPDYVCDCLPGCVEPGERPKYPPISVTEAILGGYRASYGRAKEFNDNSSSSNNNNNNNIENKSDGVKATATEILVS